MKKIFTILCCIVALLSNTSCEQYTKVEKCSVSQENTKPNPKIQRLIQQTRMGEVKAYDTLAVCYRDGDGIKQSSFNMMSMYMLSCTRSGKDINDVLEQFDANHPFRLLTEILDHVHVDKILQETVAKLRSISPADAMIYDAICAIEHRNDTIAAEQLLREAEIKGSEMACILQVLLYDKLGNRDKYEQYLLRFASRFPILYIKLRDLYMQADQEGHLQQAIEYYKCVDNSGMLTAQGARELLSAYRSLENDGKITCDEKEMKRLETLAHHK